MKLPSLELDYIYRGDGWCEGYVEACNMPGRTYSPQKKEGWLVQPLDTVRRLCRSCCARFEAVRETGC